MPLADKSPTRLTVQATAPDGTVLTRTVDISGPDMQGDIRLEIEPANESVYLGPPSMDALLGELIRRRSLQAQWQAMQAATVPVLPATGEPT